MTEHLLVKKTPEVGRFFCALILPIGLLLLFSSWLTSVHFPPWSSWHNEFAAFASAMVLGAGLLHQQRFSGFIWAPKIVVPVAAICCVIGIQALVGRITFGGDAVVQVLYMTLASVAICFGLAMRTLPPVFGKMDALATFACVVLLGAAFSTVAALVQGLDVWDAGSWIVELQNLRRPGGNLAQPNHLATLILFGFSSLLYLLASEKVGGVVGAAFAFLLFLGLSVVESRTAEISFAIMCVWFYLKPRQIQIGLPYFFIPLCVAVLVLCIWAWPVVFHLINEPGIGAAGAVHREVAPGMRVVVWPQLWAAAMQHPWLGWGLGQVSIAHNAVLDHYTQSEAFTYAHNVVLDLIIGIGLPATILLSLLFTRWIYIRVRGAKTQEEWFAISFLIPFLVHALLEFPFAYSYLLLPAMLAVGILEGQNIQRSTLRISWKLATGIWAVATATMVWSAFEYIAIEEDFRIVRFESMRLGTTPADYERPNIYLLTQLDALLNAGRIKPVPGMPQDQIDLARDVAMKYPWPATQNRYALSLALNGNPIEAQRQLKVMRALHGQRTIEDIHTNWRELSAGKYPQLKEIEFP